MSELKMKGRLIVINEREQISDTFTKREFVVVEESTKYTQNIIFQLSQDRCDLIDAFNINDVIQVSFNLKGREWVSPEGDTRYFNTVEAWKINRV